MPNIYRPRLGAKSLQGSLKKMVTFRGSNISDRRLKEVLLKSGDKDLKDFAYKQSGTTTSYQAKKIIKKFAEHVHGHKDLRFTLNAREQGIGRISASGRVSDIAAHGVFEQTAKQEIASEKPKGPTEKERWEQKRKEERIKQRNISERIRADKEKELKAEGGLQAPPATSIADIKRAKDKGLGTKTPGDASGRRGTMRMPAMAGGVPQRRLTGNDVDRAFVAPAKNEPEEAEPDQTHEPETPASETPATASDEEVATPPEPSEQSDESTPRVDDSLPFSD